MDCLQLIHNIRGLGVLNHVIHTVRGLGVLGRVRFNFLGRGVIHSRVRLGVPRLKSAGFTLIELVVAVAIFSFVALAANQVLSNVTQSSDYSERELTSLQDLQRAMLVIERDFQQITDRIPRVQSQENKLMLNGGEFEFESDADGISMVRNGWHNPQLMLLRSTLQNVVYRVQENQLQRLHTNYVDAVIGTEPRVRVLLEDIDDFQVEVLRDIGNDEDFEWSETIESTELPKAIQITIVSQHFGEIRRVFQVSL